MLPCIKINIKNTSLLNISQTLQILISNMNIYIFVTKQKCERAHTGKIDAENAFGTKSVEQLNEKNLFV